MDSTPQQKRKDWWSEFLVNGTGQIEIDSKDDFPTEDHYEEDSLP